MLALMLRRKSINKPKADRKPKLKSENKARSTIVTNDDLDGQEKPKPLTKRLFHRKSSSKRSSIMSTSSFTSSSTNQDTTPSREHPYASSPSPPISPPAPIERISVSVWNAAGQDISTLPAIRGRNYSSSNLSTTSTLLETHHPAPQSPIRPSEESYGAFLLEARDADVRREMMARAWMKAEERRKASLNWPNDPWRGGFGPPSSGVVFGRRDGGVAAFNPRKVSNGEDGVRGWLGRNGLIGR